MVQAGIALLHVPMFPDLPVLSMQLWQFMMTSSIARPAQTWIGSGGICVDVMSVILAETDARIGVSLCHGSIAYWESGSKAKLRIDPH